ncbi:MAG: hypothetical protein KC635_29880, partial [Myxococcales bacterium]|nr:hypothetical protein [Myxococcales bacterium]
SSSSSSSSGGGMESFFSSPETLMEDQGPSQAELQRALAEDRARRAAATRGGSVGVGSGGGGGGGKGAFPDATLPGSVPAPVVSPKLQKRERKAAAREAREVQGGGSKTGLIVLLAFLMLALGGIIAFLVAP